MGLKHRLDGLPATVARTLRERSLLDKDARVLLACSGGPDSTAMLEVMARLAPRWRLQLVVASIDHGLRAQAKAEIKLVARQAERLGLPFIAKKVTLDKHGSLQHAAREARYQALFELKHIHRCDYLAVGHTLNDQAETVFERILRGSGVVGWQAIHAKRADGVIRPLIDATRDQVRAYLAYHKLAYALDPTNRDVHYTRVRVREHWLPALASEHPHVVRHLAAMADDASQVVQSLNYLFGLQFAPLVEACQSDKLERKALKALPPGLRALVVYAWLRHGLGGAALKREQIAEVCALIDRPGEVFLAGGVRVGWAKRTHVQLTRRDSGFR